MNDDEPRWDLLPHEAEEFFGLGDDYDRKDLKRSYNALVRRFKPERFPKEFKKIRAAFEQLDNRFRYGREQTSLDGWLKAWPTQPAPTKPASEVPRAVDAPIPPEVPPVAPPAPYSWQALVDRLETEPLEDLYRELASQSRKTPQDYYVLAILADAAAAPDEMRFVDWLLQGLTAHREDGGLYELLYAYFRSDLPDDDIGTLLTKVSRHITDDRFYALTEELWIRHLKRVPFDAFRNLLNDCEAELRHFHTDARLTFYVRLLKASLWTADASWWGERMRFVDAHDMDNASSLEQDLMILDQLDHYWQNRSELIQRSEFFQRLDDTLRDYCTLDEPEFDQRFLQFQHWIATHAGVLARALPMGDKLPEGLESLWGKIADDVSERMPLHATAVAEEDVPDEELSALLGRLCQHENSSWRHSVSTLLVLNIACFVLGILVVAGVYLYRAVLLLFWEWRFFSALGALGASILAFAASVGLLVLCVMFSGKQDRTAYQRTWRRELMVFLSRRKFPLDLLLSQIRTIGKAEDKNKALEFIELLEKDQALVFYATAQQFPV